jgi:hypothetical protein
MEAAMVFDELVSRLHDALALRGLSPGATLSLIRRRINGASTDQLLKAAIAALVEQRDNVAQLENEIETLESEIGWFLDREGVLENAVEALETQRDKLQQQLAELDRLVSTNTSTS